MTDRFSPQGALAYVAGAFTATGDIRVLRAPYDGRELARVHHCGTAELDRALAAAEAAAPAARALSSQERAAACQHVSAALLARKEEIALVLCDESGKPLSEALGEVERAAHTFEIAAAEAGRPLGEVLPLDLRPPGRGRLGLTRRVPLGPVVGITPFNFPLNLVAHKVAPALAVGCPIVLKPAEQTPLCALLLAGLIAETPWPRGALSVVPADRQVADLLVVDERPRLLSFTGSARVGWDMKARAGRKRVALELGGNAAVILDETVTDEDFARALPKLVYGAYSYAGQKCISVQRIYVVGPRFAAFRDRLAAATAALRAGDPRDPDVFVGPMIDERNAARVEAWVREAVDQGARLHCGGERRGALLAPALLSGVDPGARLSRDEVFGPVCHIEQAADFEAALAAVNASPFGLQAAVFTRELGHALRAFEALEVGAVILNEAPSFRVDHMPYGGVKDSGLGREGVRYAMEEMSELRMLVTGTL
jgi:acyl-CoA reductase-like NAD-dependent aldehyde dehydrogenase